MSTTALRREIAAQDPDVCAHGLRRLARHLGTDSVRNERPADFERRRHDLADLEPRVLELANSDDPVLRELAADALGALLGEPALQTLLRLCQDGVDRVRASAAGALEGWPDHPQARDALLDAMLAPQWIVRMRAARALAAFAGPEVDQALLDGLVDPDSYVRTNAGESLKRRDPKGYMPALRKLADYPAPHLLDAALDLFGAVGDADDAKFLAKVGSWLNLSQPAFVRAWARKAAREIRGRRPSPAQRAGA